MNALGFFLRRIAWQFGIKRERARWGAVNRETQILSEAEDLLGRLAWRDCEHIEELTGEYWQIRDIDEQQEALRAQIEEKTDRNEDLKDKLDDIQADIEEELTGLREKKAELMNSALEVMTEIEEIKEWKEQTKKKFMNLKAKLAVLQKHGVGEGAEEQRTRELMAEHKAAFEKDLKDIAEKTDRISSLEEEAGQYDAKIGGLRQKMKDDTTELSGEISRLSKQIAENSAKIGALETAKGEFYFQVGHYLSDNIETRDPQLRQVLSKHRSMVSRITYFRRSISYNQRLARRGHG